MLGNFFYACVDWTDSSFASDPIKASRIVVPFMPTCRVLLTSAGEAV
jgi:hypothetical protein